MSVRPERHTTVSNTAWPTLRFLGLRLDDVGERCLQDQLEATMQMVLTERQRLHRYFLVPLALNLAHLCAGTRTGLQRSSNRATGA